MPEIITRAQARDAGLKRYFTGKPCKHGHIAERDTKKKRCIECSRIAGRTAYKPREAGIAKRAAGDARAAAKSAGEPKYHGRPCKKCGETERHVNSKMCVKCDRERAAIKRSERTPEQIAKRQAASAASYIRNRDKVLARGKVRNEAGYGKAYYAANKDQVIAGVKDWIKRNPEKRNVYRQQRRSSGADRLSPEIAEQIEAAQKGKCAVCRVNLKKTGKHIDHIIPVAKGGTSDPRNIQILCPTCNRRKGAKDPIEFMQSLGRLL